MDRTVLYRLMRALQTPNDTDLCGWAASEAARILKHNWESAVWDGTPIETLADDVDIVCAILMDWKKEVLSMTKEIDPAVLENATGFTDPQEWLERYYGTGWECSECGQGANGHVVVANSGGCICPVCLYPKREAY